MHTINDIFDRYVEEVLPRKKEATRRDYAWHIKTLRERFGNKIAKDLTTDEVNEFMDVEFSKDSRNRARAVMSTALTHAVRWRWIPYNVVREAKRHKAEKRNRTVTAKEIDGIKKIAPIAMALAVDFAWLTGLRQRTIVELTWNQVHEDERRILTKTDRRNKTTETPITDEVQRVLDKCRKRKLKRTSQYVLPTRTGKPFTSAGFRAGWNRVMKQWERQGRERFTFNDITMTVQREKSRVGQVPQLDASISQFDAVVRTEATEMAQHYKVFYCLEKSIRMMITDAMESAYGQGWWGTNIDPTIQRKAQEVQAMEIDAGLPPRADSMLDYTTFGQLKLIISQNWSDVFRKKLRTEKAVTNVLTTLNRMRGSIAHFSPLDEHEGKRLQFQVEEWFNLLLS